MNWKNWYQETLLQNGMRLWYRRFPAYTSALYAIVDAGGENDGAFPGMAHFTEHMLFRGTENMPRDEIKYIAAKYGIHIGAATSKEMLIFKVENVLDVQIATDILFEAIAKPTFPDDGFNKEKPIIISEIKRSEDDNSRKALNVALENMVQYPFNIPNLGYVESVESITQADMRNFHRAMFTPDRITICYTGAMPIHEIETIFNKNLGKWQPPSAHWGGNYTPKAPSPLFVEKRDLQQAFVSLNYDGISSDSPDFETMEVLADIVGGSMVSRMFLELRNEKSLCYQCGIRLPTFLSVPGIISLFGAVPNKNVSRFINGTRDIIEQIVSGKSPITQDELDSGKARFNANLYNKADNFNSQMALFMVTWKGHRSLAERVVAINSLTLDNIQTAAKKYLACEPKVIIVGDPNGA